MERYGHLHFGGLESFHKKQMVNSLSSIQQPITSCEGFILAKQHKESFSTGVFYREKAPSKLVHTDISGPMQTPSIRGSLYFWTFIDDFSKMTWVYFLKQISKAFARLKEFKTMAENQCGQHIKVLRSDRGEYNSKEFLNFFKYYVYQTIIHN